MTGTCNVKATHLFGLLAQELWPPGDNFYDFIAYLKISIPLFPEQSLLGVQVGHLPPLKKGILNDHFFFGMRDLCCSYQDSGQSPCKRTFFPWS